MHSIRTYAPMCTFYHTAIINVRIVEGGLAPSLHIIPLTSPELQPQGLRSHFGIIVKSVLQD